MSTLSHQFKIANPADGNGVQLTNLTVVIKDRDNVARATLGPATLSPTLPSWLTLISGTPDFQYQIDTELDDTLFQPDFVLLEIQADVLGGGTVNDHRAAGFASASVPTIPVGRFPYADLAFADEYWGTRLEGRGWFGYGEHDRTLALVSGTDDLDTERYKGRKHLFPGIPQGQSQAFTRRQHPRLYTEFSHGSYILDDNGIPEQIKQACCEQAMYLLMTVGVGQDPHRRMDLQQAGLSALGAGRQGETWDPARMPNDRICAAARELIQPFLLTAADVGYFD